MTWQNGRELAALTKDGKTISYSYNADGIRTEKSNDGVVTKYFYDSNNNLISLICGDTQLVFYYDVDGQADSFIVYSGDTATRYYYVKNLQGDITKIMLSDGTVVANYYYDAYGEILSITDNDGVEITDTSSVAFLNPLRYRGYVYDDDTGFYYLQSRYYDSTTKRFINSDSVFVLLLAFSTNYNLYSYCLNNPVNMLDLCGYLPYKINSISIIGLLIITKFSFTATGSQLADASVVLAAVIDIVCIIIGVATGGSAAVPAAVVGGIVTIVLNVSAHFLDKYASKQKFKVSIYIPLHLYRIKAYRVRRYGVVPGGPIVTIRKA